MEHNPLKSAEEVSAQGEIKMSVSVSSTGLPSAVDPAHRVTGNPGVVSPIVAAAGPRQACL